MDGMAGMAGVSDAPQAATASEATTIPLAVRAMCGEGCVAELTAACSVAGGIAVMSLLFLLLGARRDTYLGLIRCTGPPVSVDRWRNRTPWTVLSPVALCVLRV